MITIEQTTDDQYIKSVFLNPEIYKEMKDDASPADPSALAHVNVQAVSGFFLKAILDGNPVGCFWFIWKSADTLEVHTALLKSCRGRNALRVAREAARWVFTYTGAKEITSYAWSDSPAVAWFCRAMGMEKRESKPWPNTRNGKPVDITYYAIGRTI